MAQLLDLMICVFPFERPMYESQRACRRCLSAILCWKHSPRKDPALSAMEPCLAFSWKPGARSQADISDDGRGVSAHSGA